MLNDYRLRDDTEVTLRVEGEAPVTTTLGAFLADNADGLDADEVAAIHRALFHGELHEGGGGAEPLWTVERRSVELAWIAGHAAALLGGGAEGAFDWTDYAERRAWRRGFRAVQPTA